MRPEPPPELPWVRSVHEADASQPPIRGAGTGVDPHVEALWVPPDGALPLDRRPGLLDWFEDLVFTGLLFVATAQLLYEIAGR